MSTNPLFDLYTSSDFDFKRPFVFNNAVTTTVTVTIKDTKTGGKYLRAVFQDAQGSELVMPYNLTLEGIQYNRDFFNHVIRSNAPDSMKEHTLSSEQMLIFVPRLFELVSEVKFEVVAVAKYNREKDNKKVWLFESIDAAEEYLEAQKQKSKGIPVKSTEKSQQSDRVLQSLGL